MTRDSSGIEKNRPFSSHGKLILSIAIVAMFAIGCFVFLNADDSSADFQRESRTIVPVDSGNALHMRIDNGGVLYWDEVDGATGYRIILESQMLIQISYWDLSPSPRACPIISYLDQIKCDSDRYFIVVEPQGVPGSSASMSYFYTSNVDKLESPKNLMWLGNNIVWDYVDGATNYQVIIYGFSGEVATINNAASPLDSSAYSPQDGWTFKVQAKTDHKTSDPRDSNYSESPKKGSDVRTVPDVDSGNALNMRLSDNILVWNVVEGATGYRIVLSTQLNVEIAHWDTSIAAFALVTMIDQAKIESGSYKVEVQPQGVVGQNASMSFYYTSNVGSLDSPYGLQWIANRAAWEAVEGATAYRLILFSFEGQVISLSTTSTLYDLSEYSPQDGWTFKVQALSNGTISAPRDSKAMESPELVLPKPVYTIECCSYDIDNMMLQGGTVQIITDKGTTDTELDTTAYATEGTQVTIKAVSNTGYDFVAWKVSSPFVLTPFSTEWSYTFTADDDIFLYAVFQQVFTVSFNANSGSGTMADVEGVHGNYTLPANGFTAPDNSHFKGWATSAGGAVIETPDISVTADTTLYAIWETNAFTKQPVNQAGNTSDHKEISPEWDVNFTATKYEVVEGSTVIDTVTHKWFDISSDVEKERTFTIRAYYDSNHFIVSDEFVLSWVATVYTVGYYPQGDGGSGSGDLYYAKDGSSVTIIDYALTGIITDAGYKFDHWSVGGVTKQTGDSITITDDTFIYAIYVEKTVDHLEAEYTGGSVFAGHTLEPSAVSIKLYYSDDSFDVKDINQATFKIGTTDIAHMDTYIFSYAGNIDITVTSEEVSDTMTVDVIGRTVSFASNGGTGSMETVYEYGLYNLPLTPGFTAPEGKQFYKWALGSPSGTQYAGGAPYTVNDNVVFYALWRDIPYTVSFNPNGGSGSMADVEDVHGNYILPANGFAAPAEMQFKGWATSAGGTVIATSTINVTADTTLFAIWEDIPTETYTVIFVSNGGSGSMTPALGISGQYALPACTFTAPAGKEFKCWSVNDTEKSVGESISVTADVIATAVWKESVGPQPEPITPEPAYDVKDVDGKKVYSNEIVSGTKTNVSGIFNDAKTNSGSVNVKVGTMDIAFDSDAVSAIGGKTVSLKAELKTTVLDIDGAKAIVEVTLDGATFTGGKATVTIPFNETVPDGKVVVVYYINGTSKEKVDATYQDGKIVFTTNHFSKYAVMFDDASSPNGGGFPIWIVIVIVVVIAAAGIGVFFFMKNKKA